MSLSFQLSVTLTLAYICNRKAQAKRSRDVLAAALQAKEEARKVAKSSAAAAGAAAGAAGAGAGAGGREDVAGLEASR